MSQPNAPARRLVVAAALIALLAAGTGIYLLTRNQTSTVVTRGTARPTGSAPAQEPPIPATPLEGPGTVEQPFTHLRTTTADGRLIDAKLIRTILGSDDPSRIECHEPTTVDVLVETATSRMIPDFHKRTFVAGSSEIPLPGAGEIAVAKVPLGLTDRAHMLNTGSLTAGIPEDGVPDTESGGGSLIVAYGPGLAGINTHESDGTTNTARPSTPGGLAAVTSGWEPSFTSMTIERTSGAPIVVHPVELASDSSLGASLLLDSEGHQRSSSAVDARTARRCTPVNGTHTPDVTVPPPSEQDAAAVRSLMASFVSNGLSSQQRADLTDDPARILRLDRGDALSTWIPSISLDVTGVSFTDDSTAIIQGLLHIPTLSPVATIGKAVRSDQGWRLTWQSVCTAAIAIDVNHACSDAPPPASYPPEAVRTVPIPHSATR
ncbi:MAG: hypothetical protein JST64_09610 [Actinobacteria bacterium]|nr:hypothetical protein [Actinomycetota bacterium]